MALLNKYRYIKHSKLKRKPIVAIYEDVLSGERKSLPRGTWVDDRNVIILIRYALEIKLQLREGDIPKINRRLIKQYKLFGALNRFKSEKKLIQFVYANKYDEFDFSRVSPGYWDINSIKSRLEYYLKKGNYTIEDIPKIVKYDKLVEWGLSNPLKRFNHSPYRLINALYPQKFTPYQFRKIPQGTATKKSRLKKHFFKMLTQENIAFRNIPKHVNQEMLIKYRFSGALDYYQNSPSRFIMDLFPGSFNIREFNRTNYYWQDANNAYNEIVKLVKENQIPQEKIPVYFTKEFLQENNLYGLLHEYNGSPIEIINKFFPDQYNITEFQRVPNKYWYKRENRVDALRAYCKQNDLGRNQLTNLSRAYFKKYFPRFISVLDRHYDSRIYNWIKEAFPEYTFEPEEFNLHIGIDGQRCDSNEELMIHNYLVKTLRNAQLKSSAIKFINTLERETYIPDWVIQQQGQIFIIEYFGLYQSKRFPEYTKKASRKIKYFNGLSDYNFIAIKPDDFRRKGFKTIRGLLLDKGLKLYPVSL